MSVSPVLQLGTSRAPDGSHPGVLRLPAHHLVTHGCVLGMTGSGKTGLLTVLLEEALRGGVPVLMIDVKRDLPNLLLPFADFAGATLEPWIDVGPNDPRSRQELAECAARERREHLARWSIAEPELAAYRAATAFRVITPGVSSGELLHVLSSLERHGERWTRDTDSARAALSAAVSLVLRLLGRDPDPARSKEHVLLSVLAEQRIGAGQPADLGSLLQDLARPPLERIGALEVDAFMSKTDRRELAASLNTLLASPTFANWRNGATLDVAGWLAPIGKRTPAVIVSVAHLDDEEQALVLGVLLEEVLAWVRTLPGSQRLRALVVFDEVYAELQPVAPPRARSRRARSPWIRPPSKLRVQVRIVAEVGRDRSPHGSGRAST